MIADPLATLLGSFVARYFVDLIDSTKQGTRPRKASDLFMEAVGDAFDPNSVVNQNLRRMGRPMAALSRNAELRTMRKALKEIESTLTPVDLDALSPEGAAIDERLGDIIQKAGKRT